MIRTGDPIDPVMDTTAAMATVTMTVARTGRTRWATLRIENCSSRLDHEKDGTMNKSKFTQFGLGLALLTGVGCSSNHEPMPGPGPTAMPRTMDGRDVGAGSGVNTEMRQGSTSPMTGTVK